MIELQYFNLDPVLHILLLVVTHGSSLDMHHLATLK